MEIVDSPPMGGNRSLLVRFGVWQRMATRTEACDVALIVLNYRTPRLVVDCLGSLDGQVDPGRHDVVVVDNCSGDGSGEQIRRAIAERGWQGWARVIESPLNGGFAAGNNVGIWETRSNWCVLLNSDTLVRPGALEELLNAADRSGPEIGLIGPRLEWLDGEVQVSTFRFRTPLTELIASSRSGWLGRRFLGHVVAKPVDRACADLDWVSFACVAIRREVIERVGLLDDRYFMYFEDMDYCRRARLAGFKVAYEPAARVVHLRGGSSEVKRRTVERKRRPQYYYRARSHYFRSWYGVSGLWLGNVLWSLGWLLSLIRGKSMAVSGEWRDIWTRSKSGQAEVSRHVRKVAPSGEGQGHE